MSADPKTDGPDSSIIDPIKAQFPNRAVATVTMTVAGKDFNFVMTSPNRDERKKYISEMKAAGNGIEKIETAIEKAALAMIRWPARDVVTEIFNNHSGMIQHFADELAKLDGSGAEVHSKNS